MIVDTFYHGQRAVFATKEQALAGACEITRAVEVLYDLPAGGSVARESNAGDVTGYIPVKLTAGFCLQTLISAVVGAARGVVSNAAHKARLNGPIQGAAIRGRTVTLSTLNEGVESADRPGGRVEGFDASVLKASVEI